MVLADTLIVVAGVSAQVMLFVVILCSDCCGYNCYMPWGKKGLSASNLEMLPKVTGKDLVLANYDCVICLDEIENGQPARMLPDCNHGFHLQCADAWLSKNPTCPVCRSVVRLDLFNPLHTNNPC